VYTCDKCKCYQVNITVNRNGTHIKALVYDPVIVYNHVEDTKVSVSIERTNAKQCTLSEIFVSEILNRFQPIISDYDTRTV